MYRALLFPLCASALVGCIGELPADAFPCLIATDTYDKYNEAYVFSPRGEPKRQAMTRSQAAEQDCASGEVTPGAPVESE